MYYDDHHPLHFHARYGGSQALVHINTAVVAAGMLPSRIERQVLLWTNKRQLELLDHWERALSHQPLEWINP
jgi:hypothetical protein